MFPRSAASVSGGGNTTTATRGDVLGEQNDPGTVPSQSCPSWVVDETVLFLIGIAGALMVLLLWLAPMRDIWLGRDSVWATRSTKRVATGFPYVAAVFNCVLWNMYATSNPRHFLVPLFVNTIGFLLNVSFTWCYWRFAPPDGAWVVVMQFTAFLVFTILAVALWFAVDVEVVGYMAAIVNTLMFFGPLMAARQVIRARSTLGMPFPPLVLTLCTSAVWLVYGVYLCNAQTMIPNGLGVVFGVAQISLYAWAKQHEKRALLSGFDELHGQRAPAYSDDSNGGGGGVGGVGGVGAGAPGVGSHDHTVMGAGMGEGGPDLGGASPPQRVVRGGPVVAGLGGPVAAAQGPSFADAAARYYRDAGGGAPPTVRGSPSPPAAQQ